MQHAPGTGQSSRNTPCPCGSGRKYKRCCGASADSPDPASAQRCCETATRLLNAGRLDEAIAWYRQALIEDAHLAPAHANLGVALQARGLPLEALASLQAAMGHGRGTAVGLAATANHLACVNAYQGQLFQLLRSGACSAAEIARQTRLLGRLVEDGIGRIAPHTNSPDPDRRLRIAYLSPDLRRHSVAYFVDALIANHDRGQVEVHCYYCGPDPDPVTERFRGAADHWLDCAGQTPDALATRIRADGIDILIDLAGHTAGNQLLTLARKPAPIQISYLGYPATTGLHAMDFRITDPHADPAGLADALFTEKPLRLPRTMLLYRPPFGPGGLLGTGELAVRSRVQQEGVTFGCFNSLSKWSAATFRAWAQLLTVVPRSRLVLKSPELDDPACADRVRAQLRGVAGVHDRLVLLGRDQDSAAHLRRYDDIDVALDTFPYNGVTTSLEAIWMGVPFVTLAGTTLAGRMGVSIATNVGHPEWIAASAQDYVTAAAALAAHRGRLTELRSSLRQQLEASALRDGAGFASELEELYRQSWRYWCERRGPGTGDHRSRL